MNVWRVVFLALLSAASLAGCLSEEKAVTDIGGEPPTPTEPLSLAAPASRQAEASGPMTSVNLGQATATGGNGVYTFSHNAPAGGFPLGATTVTWTVTDGAGAMAKDTQSVMVSDTIAPNIILPPDVQSTATGELTMVGIGIARTTDLVDPFPSLTNDRPSNGFPLGTTAVTWTSTDASGNVATGRQMVTVVPPNPDPGPLTLAPPAAITTEATGSTTAVVLGNAMASGGAPPITITNDAPVGGFPLGVTTVTWTAVDANSASASGTQLVTIRDTTAPSITAPPDVAANQDAGGGNTMVDLGSPMFSDLVDPNPMVSNNAPANGFAVGTTTVVWTATDFNGNSASDTQQVTINGSSFTVTPPPAVTAEATGPRTMVTLGNATANGGVPLVTISNNAPANGFPVGVTTVTWTATDMTAATAVATQTVTITDTRAPSITAPADVSAAQNASGGNTFVNLGTPTLSDIADPNPTARNNAPASGFPVGTTTVVWTATDASGNFATDTQLVVITASTSEQCSALMSDWVGSVFPMMDTATTCGGACHVTATPLQTANGWGFPDSATDEQNLEVFRTVARINFQNESLVTAKARGFTQHGGGAVLQEGTANYAVLSDFVARARACTVAPPPPSGTAKVIRGSGYEQLSKLTFAVASRPPTSDEVNVIAAAGSD
ncbi:MAG: HYR domain-containing protein, partial [Gammaproteobacteria bacterium]|nr:HYR domain-containing protein [Gammaproteobacteria bacterium]